MKIGRISLIISAIVFFILLSMYLSFTRSLKDPESLIPLSVKMAFSDGTPFYIPRNSWIRLNEVPKIFVKLLLASEDRKFFSHIGIDIKGLLRAFWANLRSGEIVQGGSTITQQLARSLYLGHSRTLRRKIKEIFVALWLEKIRTKQEILEMYINSVYMGNGVYGFQTASLYYFGKELPDLSIAEMASLIATIRSPEKFNPEENIEINRKKAEAVLDAALETKVIDGDEYEKALNSLKKLRVVRESSLMDEEIFWRVVEEVEELTGMTLDVLRNGYTVITTLDRKLQSVVNKTVGKDMACVAIDGLGRILAYKGIGVRHGSRQIGSLVKPFYYLIALLDSAKPSDLLLDIPVKIGSWSPENFSKSYRVESTLENALVFSRNVPSVYLFVYLGKSQVEEFMKNILKIEGNYPDDATLALGTLETAPEQILKFYTALMSGGVVLEPSVIEKILDPSGNVIYSFEPRVVGRIPDGAVDHYRALGILKDIMMEVVKRGTAFRAKLNRPSFGKTGTSKTNAWFVGGDDDFVMAVVKDGKGLLGGRDVAPIWRDTVQKWGRFKGEILHFKPVRSMGKLLVNEDVLSAVDYTKLASMVEFGEIDLTELRELLQDLGDYSQGFIEKLFEVDSEVASSLIMEVNEWKK